MAIKTEILNNLKAQIENLNIAKKVIRGVQNIGEVRDVNLPLIAFNSTEIINDETHSHFNISSRRMTVEVYLIDRQRNDSYYNKLDEYEESLIKLFECINPNDLSNKCFMVNFLSSAELINDDKLAGYIAIVFKLHIFYYA